MRLTDDMLKQADTALWYLKACGGFDDEVGTLRAALEQASSRPTLDGNAWQPIETAPKDGRTLLLGYLNACGKWRTVRGQWMSQNYIDEYWEDPDDVEPGWFETAEEAEDIPNCWGIDPSHRMPLPAAPGSDKGGA